jgi:hypothetical protein
VATDEGGELDVRLEHDLRELGRVAATYRGRVIAAPPTWITAATASFGNAVKHIDRPLHLVELQPQRIIKINIGLVRAAYPERQSSLVGQITHRAIRHRRRAAATGLPTLQLVLRRPAHIGAAGIDGGVV